MVAACKPQAGERLYRWPAQWRSGGGAEGTALAGGTEPWRGLHPRDGGGRARDAVARRAACWGLSKRHGGRSGAKVSRGDAPSQSAAGAWVGAWVEKPPLTKKPHFQRLIN